MAEHGEEQEDEDGAKKPRQRWSRASLRASVEAAGALTGTVVGGPVGAVVGAAVPTVVFAAMDQFGASWTAKRRENAARVLTTAAEDIGASAQEALELAVGDDRKGFLVGEALNAGGST